MYKRQILTSLKLMEVMLEKKEKLGKLTSPVDIYPQLLKNIRVKSKPEAREDADVKNCLLYTSRCV